MLSEERKFLEEIKNKLGCITYREVSPLNWKIVESIIKGIDKKLEAEEKEQDSVSFFEQFAYDITKAQLDLTRAVTKGTTRAFADAAKAVNQEEEKCPYCEGGEIYDDDHSHPLRGHYLGIRIINPEESALSRWTMDIDAGESSWFLIIEACPFCGRELEEDQIREKPELMKVCEMCEQEKPADEFPKTINRPDGLQRYCKQCFAVGRGNMRIKDEDQ